MNEDNLKNDLKKRSVLENFLFKRRDVCTVIISKNENFPKPNPEKKNPDNFVGKRKKRFFYTFSRQCQQILYFKITFANSMTEHSICATYKFQYNNSNKLFLHSKIFE